MIDKTLSTPLYEQVANEVRKEVLSGIYGESGSIGTHTQLAERFNVSLITIRKAIQTLEEEGLVNIQQGKGTFVRHSALVDPLQNLTAISDMMSSLQVKTDTAVPIFERRKVPDWVENDVRKALGKRPLFLCRVVSIRGTPYSCAEMYLPEKYADAFDQDMVVRSTVYQIYQTKLGLTLGKGKQVIRAAGAQGNAATYLQLLENSPVLQIERKAYDRDGNLIQYLILTYEADKYAFSVEMELKKM